MEREGKRERKSCATQKWPVAHRHHHHHQGTTALGAGATFSVRDRLPTGATLVGTTPGTGIQSVSCTGTTSLVCPTTLSTTLAVGGTATFTLTMTAPTSTTSYINYASVSIDGQRNAPTAGPACTQNNCAFAPAVVNSPALTMTKTGPGSGVTGAQATFTFTVTNSGTAAVPAGTTVNVLDLLPTGSTYVSSAPGAGVASVACTGTSLLTCLPVIASGGLAIGGTATFTITMTLGTGSVNYASVSPDGVTAPPTPGPSCSGSCASSTTTLNAPVLALSKTGPAAAIPGSQATYTLTITNTGTVAAPGGVPVVVSDQLPAGAAYVSSSAGTGVSALTCTGASLVSCSVTLASSLAVGASATFTLTMTLPTGSSSVNYAAVSPDGVTAPPTPGPSCVSASCASSTTTLTSPVLALGKTSPAVAVPGGQVTYTLTITNSGGVATPAGVAIPMLDQLPPGAVYASSAPGPGATAVTCSGTSLVSCDVTPAAGGLAPGATAVFYITATMPSPHDGVLSNIASVSIDGVTPPVDPATACAGLGRRRLLCSTCACAGCSTDVYDPNDKAAVLKRKAAATAAGLREAKVEAQQRKQGLFDAIANATETKLAAANPALEAKVAATVAEIDTKKQADAARDLALYDALTNKTFAGGAGVVAASEKLGTLATNVAAVADDVERHKAAEHASAAGWLSAVANKTKTLGNKNVFLGT